MACEQDFMYQAYLNYLARKTAEGGEGVTAEEKAFLEANGISFEPAPEASAFSCDPVSQEQASGPANPFSRMGPKAS